MLGEKEFRAIVSVALYLSWNDANSIASLIQVLHFYIRFTKLPRKAIFDPGRKNISKIIFDKNLMISFQAYSVAITSISHLGKKIL